MVTKKYYSTEENWNQEKKQVGPLEEALTLMQDVDTLILDAKEICDADKYGTPTGLQYSSIVSSIRKMQTMQEHCVDYLGWIHEKVEDVEETFTKQISKITEKVSKIDINEYEVENSTRSTKEVQIDRYSDSTVKVKKDKITYKDLLRDGDVLDLKERYKEYKKLCKESGDKIVSKEEYISYLSTTAFNHEMYADSWTKGWNDVLNMIPVVGNVKNLIEAIAGQSITGELDDIF